MSGDASTKIEQFFSQFRKRELAKGQILIHSGDQPQYVYYLVSGKVRQYDVTYRGDEMIVNIFNPGAFFPMLPTVTKLPNKYFFETETAVTAYLAPPEATAEFLKSNPEVMYDLLARVYAGLDGLMGRMFQLMSGSAKSRVMYELLIECRRFGEKNSDGSYYIAVHEADIAARAGLSRETVSREIQKIGQDGLISVTHKGIEITDITILEKLLGSEL